MFKKMKKDKGVEPYEIAVYSNKDLNRIISADTGVSQEVVDLVLRRFGDVVIELAVNHNIVRFTPLFVMEPYIYNHVDKICQ